MQVFFDQHFYEYPDSDKYQEFLYYMNAIQFESENKKLRALFKIRTFKSDSEIIAAITGAVQIYNRIEFQTPIPVVLREVLPSAAPSDLLSETLNCLVYQLSTISEELFDLSYESIIKVDKFNPNRLIFKLLKEPIKTYNYQYQTGPFTGATFRMARLTEFYNSIHIRHVSRVTHYESIVLDATGKIVGFLIEKAHLGDGTVFAKKYIPHLKNNFYLINEFYELAKTINEIHSLGLIHRDLKNNNILVFKKDPESAEIDGNYEFRVTDYGHMNCIGISIQVHSRTESQKVINEPAEYFYPEMRPYSGLPSIDWYQYGYILISFFRRFMEVKESFWFLRVFYPLITGLTCRDPPFRFGYEQVEKYFKLLINPETGDCISEKEIITTISFAAEGISEVKIVGQKEESSGTKLPIRVYLIQNGIDCLCFVRSILGSVDSFEISFKIVEGNADKEGEESKEAAIEKTHKFVSRIPISNYEFFPFQGQFPFFVTSNMTFSRKHMFDAVELMMLDSNWSDIWIKIEDGENEWENFEANTAMVLAQKLNDAIEYEKIQQYYIQLAKEQEEQERLAKEQEDQKGQQPQQEQQQELPVLEPQEEHTLEIKLHELQIQEQQVQQ